MVTPLQELDVAVVGAGVAGLNCARLLARAGLRVAVLDKARGAGGRMATRRGTIVNHDHGAQYFTARDPAFLTWMAELQVAGSVARWAPRIVAFDQTGRREVTDEARYVGVPGMSAVCRSLLGDLPFFAGHRLIAMTRDGQAWRLDFDNGQTATCRQLVLALPAPQAAALLDAYPDLKHTAASVTMQPCWAVMLRYEQPLAVDFDAAFVNAGTLSWLARNSSKPGRPLGDAWVLHGSPSWSAQYLEADAEEVVATLTAEFAGLAGTSPQPAEISAHRWRYAQIAQALNVGAIYDPASDLGLAGDWLNGGRVEGAWLSGYLLAQRMLAQAGHTGA